MGGASLMSGESEDAVEAANRLEAALERIARAQPQGADVGEAGRDALAERIDSLINRLRAALGRTN